MFRNIVDQYNLHFNLYEQVKKFRLLPTKWTIEGGELTPTLKPKRKAITEKNREIIEKLYTT